MHMKLLIYFKDSCMQDHSEEELSSLKFSRFMTIIFAISVGANSEDSFLQDERTEIAMNLQSGLNEMTDDGPTCVFGWDKLFAELLVVS